MISDGRGIAMDTWKLGEEGAINLKQYWRHLRSGNDATV
jgi:hypothetical protein